MEINAAVVSEQSGDFIIEKLQIEEPNPDEVLVRIVSSGICHTDLAARDGYLPTLPPPSVFGHEGSGVVEKVGKGVTKVKPGDHVVLGWDYCGECTACKADKYLYCHNFFLHNFHGARPNGTTTLKKGDQVIHGSFFNQFKARFLVLICRFEQLKRTAKASIKPFDNPTKVVQHVLESCNDQPVPVNTDHFIEINVLLDRLPCGVFPLGIDQQ